MLLLLSRLAFEITVYRIGIRIIIEMKNPVH